jgi:transcriptional regulator with XRE-family HTH domain
MTHSVIKGAPALVGDARRALRLNQEEFANLIGSSKRTVQRWETRRATPLGSELATIAAKVHRADANVAAAIAKQLGQTLEGLGIVHPPPPPAPPPPPPLPQMPRHLAVDAVVCVASEELGVMPSAIRSALRVAFRRARELGLSYDEVERALEERLKSAAKTKPHGTAVT